MKYTNVSWLSDYKEHLSYCPLNIKSNTQWNE